MRLFFKKGVIIFLLLVLLSVSVLAGGAGSGSDLDERLKSKAVFLVLATTALLTLLIGYAIYDRKKLASKGKKNQKIKVILFGLIVIAVLGTTFFVAGSTIYLNMISVTGGPVHWHSDFEIWTCGQKVDLLNPTGLSNKIGSATYHEHNDDRLHVEGVVIEYKDVNLQKFFELIGGSLEQGKVAIPTDDGMKKYKDNDLCNEVPSELQVFLYRVENPGDKGEWRYSLTKLTGYTDYILKDTSYVPPGDCFIIEFGPSRDTTDHMCETYEIAVAKGELRGS